MNTLVLDPPDGCGVGPPKSIEMHLVVRDPETVSELWRQCDDESRNSYALSALRLGVLALRQASGIVDVSAIRGEGERLVSSVRELLSERSSQLLTGLSAALRQYFDPNDGQLPQRLERLVKREGELESMLVRHLSSDGSTIARTLAAHMGEQSPLLRMLSPNQSDGILKALTDVVTDALHQQRQHVMGQFSLDQADSALSRLVKLITDSNGKFRSELANDVTKVCVEFSLDNPDGALTRLVGQVEKAQRSIVEQFSLDNENSALRRMSSLLESTSAAVRANLTLDDEKSPLACLRRELMHVLGEQNKTASALQNEIRSTLETFRVRRDEASRSTVHGGDFEQAVGSVLGHEVARTGDVFEHVGNNAGSKSRCKTGDYAITLGPESPAPDARIVFEAKADKSYTLGKALLELQEARENRLAQVGVFVFSADAAPEGLDPLSRFGSDIVVTWDRDDPSTDVYLKGALSVARALVVRNERALTKTSADVSEIESAVGRIAGHAKTLHEITTYASTVKNSGQKILEKTERVREDLEAQIERLLDHVGRLKSELRTKGEAA